VSRDTRAVLLSGEHPMLANGAGATGIQNMAPAESTPDSEMSGGAMADGANGQNAARPRKQNAGGKAGALQGRGFGNIPQLTGLPQIVGLALGSPEFQRH
jgi:hypothetical protein